MAFLHRLCSCTPKTDKGKVKRKSCPMPTINPSELESFIAPGRHPRRNMIGKKKKHLYWSPLAFYPQYLQRGKRMRKLYYGNHRSIATNIDKSFPLSQYLISSVVPSGKMPPPLVCCAHRPCSQLSNNHKHIHTHIKNTHVPPPATSRRAGSSVYRRRVTSERQG